jgi:hypothetical protein
VSEGEDRIVSPDAQAGETRDKALRPLSFDDFVGQKASIANLRVFVDAAGRRGEALDHVLLSGPPGLGKTTLAQIVAKELGVNFPRHLRPGHRQGGRSGCDPDQLWKSATSCSLMRSTACFQRWRRSSIRPWKTSPWIW